MTAVNDQEWQEIGKHAIRFESPDVVHVRFYGDLTRPEAERILDFDSKVGEPGQGLFAFIDIASAGRPNLEILRSKELMDQMHRYRAFVYYHAQFHHRTVLEIVARISRSLNLSLSKTPLVAFATEDEARAWVEEQRRQIS